MRVDELKILTVGKIIRNGLVMRSESQLFRHFVRSKVAHFAGIIGGLKSAADLFGQVQDQDGVLARVIISRIEVEERVEFDYQSGLFFHFPDSSIPWVFLPFHEAGRNAPAVKAGRMCSFNQQNFAVLDNYGAGGRYRIMIMDEITVGVAAGKSVMSVQMFFFEFSCAERAEVVAAKSSFSSVHMIHFQGDDGSVVTGRAGWIKSAHVFHQSAYQIFGVMMQLFAEHIFYTFLAILYFVFILGF